MPVYVCNTRAGAIDDAAKPHIAEDITRIHCEITGAPPTFVHAFFFEDVDHIPLNGNSAFLFGSIRGGRSDAQKAQLASEMRASIHKHTGIPLDEIVAMTADTPASWVMEGGDILPEPGEEEAWLKAHEAKLAAADSSQS